ncbi:UDP-N-acetylmuramoyl-tripeptide--D-alanyl-D-alanine ligase [candidate division WOR-3 bacterium]|nr:UDP-N-acetylmuramoyl-tripeptide--D-alanyl-D-alanine ligase [candidate division WOR-3 bacterium]
MRTINLKEILNIIDGDSIGISNPDRKNPVGVSVDSRKIKEGELFFALKGERFDGHDFVSEAIKKSCLPAVVERKTQGDNLILVEHSLKALGDLALYYRNIVSPFVIGITGSVGKTTVKEFLGSIFFQVQPTLKSFMNYNNLIGVPLNIFRLENEKVAILELASNEKGEIKRLSEIVMPDWGLITSIGRSHLEAFKDLKGVLEEKKGIMAGLKGPLFINGDDKLLSTIKYDDLIRVGFKKDNDYSFKQVQSSIDGSIFQIKQKEFYIQLPSMGALRSAIFATAIALRYGISDEVIQKGLISVKPIPHRLGIKRQEGITIIDDTYNSNPDSLLNSLSVMSIMHGRKVAVLGGMLELGDNSQKLHRDCGKELQNIIDELIVIGEEARGFLDGFGGGLWVKDKDDAYEELKNIIKDGDIILFKSSHFLHLETLVLRLEEGICSISCTH